MITVVIDRIEGAMAVAEIEEGRFAKIPTIFIPDAKEGDCVEIGPAKVSRFYFASIDDNMMIVLCPKGKYAMDPVLSGGAKPGEPISCTVRVQETIKRKGKISGLMNKLFE